MMIKIKTVIIIASIIIGLASVSLLAIATPDYSIQTILETHRTVTGEDIIYPDGSTLISSHITTMPPGSQKDWHTHEYPLFVYIMEGEVTIEYGDDYIIRFSQGDSFVETINLHQSKNEGDITAKLLTVEMGEE